MNEKEFNPKYNMTKEENIFLAKRNIVDYIWKSANLEGIGVTYPDTQAICNGMSVAGYSIDDINAINDLKNAWKFLLDSLDTMTDLEYIRKVHAYLGKFTVINAGCLRLDEVRIGGTDWTPEIPDDKIIAEQVRQVLDAEDTAISKALDLTLYLMRTQLFYDGNKRLAMLIGNKIMITNGQGIISVKQKDISEFYQLLVTYYETGNKTKIKQFLYDNCIDGAVFSK
jgi:prophage maintenance system killer protein